MPGLVSPAARKWVCSSIGRAAVSKAAGCTFESCRARFHTG
ncbi:hypothetical protein ANAYA_5 [Mycobacterium phage Anaya]|uniref:Uncharacterized protein n=1 Tax=Mycobacterium phage Anaya TaxID=2902832 RepID=G1BPV4_9CAUD|nr:hypothetical protein FDI60_gp05 [Mycobacterium phage Anaya]AEK07965.1 hypothetical protein ANAYA_5 [Mycobacterium phage Anaya]